MISVNTETKSKEELIEKMFGKWQEARYKYERKRIIKEYAPILGLKQREIEDIIQKKLLSNRGKLINEMFHEWREADHEYEKEKIQKKYKKLLNVKKEEIDEIIQKKIKREKLKRKPLFPNFSQEYKKLKEDFILALTKDFEKNESNIIPKDKFEIKIAQWRKNAILNMLFFLSRIGRGNFVEEYTDFDEKNRGSFLRYNIIGLNPAEKLAILQVFWYAQWKSKEYSTKRKNYYIIGITEKKRVFTHPISGHHAWRIVQYYEWQPVINRLLFGDEDVIRQGEVGFIPVKKKGMEKVINEKGEEKEERFGSHVVKGKFYDDFVLNPVAIHLRNQHDTLYLQGIFRVVKAKEKPEWDFSQRVRD